MLDLVSLLLIVLGAFAFTLSIPVIILGNGLGAIVVRQLTVGNIERIKKYKYLNNGAMYSVLALGVVMIIDAFGVHVPSWLSQVITFSILGYFFLEVKEKIGNRKRRSFFFHMTLKSTA